MLFTLQPERYWRVSLSRQDFVVRNLKTGEEKEIPVRRVCRVSEPTVRTTLPGPQKYTRECDGVHGCRYHGLSCPELRAQKLARASARTETTAHLAKRTTARASARSARVVVSPRKATVIAGALALIVGGVAPTIELAIARAVYDCVPAGTVLADDWGISMKARNQLMHALNGNIFGAFQRWLARQRELKAGTPARKETALIGRLSVILAPNLAGKTTLAKDLRDPISRTQYSHVGRMSSALVIDIDDLYDYETVRNLIERRDFTKAHAFIRFQARPKLSRALRRHAEVVLLCHAETQVPSGLGHTIVGAFSLNEELVQRRGEGHEYRAEFARMHSDANKIFAAQHDLPHSVLTLSTQFGYECAKFLGYQLFERKSGDATPDRVEKPMSPSFGTTSVLTSAILPVRDSERKRRLKRWASLESAIGSNDVAALSDVIVAKHPLVRAVAGVVPEDAIVQLKDRAASWGRQESKAVWRGEGWVPQDDDPYKSLYQTANRFHGQMKTEALALARFAAEIEDTARSNELLSDSPLGLHAFGRRVPDTLTAAVNQALIMLDRGEFDKIPMTREEAIAQHKNARDSTQADIELNPGPIARRAILASINFLTDRVLIPITDRIGLSIKVKALSNDPDEILKEEIADWAQLEPDPNDDNECPRPTQLAPQFCKMVACEHAIGNVKPHCRVTHDVGSPAYLKAIDGITDPFSFVASLTGRVCHQYPRSENVIGDFIAGGRTWAASTGGPPARQFLTIMDRRVSRFKCTDESHDVHAVKAWHERLPAFNRAEHGGIVEVNFRWQGFGHYQCPLCFETPNLMHPDIPYDTGLDASERVRIGEIIAWLAYQFKAAGTASRVLYLLATVPEEPILTSYVGVHIVLIREKNDRQPAWHSKYKTVDLPAFLWAAGMIITRLAGGLASQGGRYIVAYINHLTRFTPQVFGAPAGTWYLVQPDGLHGVAWLVDPLRDPIIAEGAWVVALRYAYANQIWSHWAMSVVPLRSYYLTESGGLDYAGLEVDLREAPLMHISGVVYDGATRVAARYHGPAIFSLPAAVMLIRKMTAAPPRAVSSLAAIALARHNAVHRGREYEITAEMLPFVPLPIPVCGCFQCLMRHRYGPIYIGLGGTRGDRLPFMALGRVLLDWGLDVIFVELISIQEGEKYLAEIQQGKMLQRSLNYVTHVGRLNAVNAITFGPMEMFPSATWTIAPPLTVRRPHNFRLGPTVNSVLAFFAGEYTSQPRVAAYAGVLNLPRSTDGKAFLPVIKKTGVDKRLPTPLYAMGSSGFPVPQGAHVVQPGDHFTQFLKYSVVVTHGGAGTVQTAAAAGARVIAADNSLDRAYFDPSNAGHGVQAGADPNKVILMLLSHDFGPFIFAMRGGIRLWCDAIRWYCMMYLFTDIATVFTLLRAVPGGVPLAPVGLRSAFGIFFAGLFCSGISQVIVSYALSALSDVLVGYLTITPFDLFLYILRAGRAISASPLASIIFITIGPRAGIITSLLLTSAPGMGYAARLAAKGDTYIAFYYHYGMPIHTVLENGDCSLQYEGTAMTGLRETVYKVARTHRGSAGRAFRFKVNMDLHRVDMLSGAARPYFVLSNNCHTVLFALWGNAPALMGHVVIILGVTWLFAALLGAIALGFLLLACLTAIVMFLVIGADVQPALVVIHAMTTRERDLLALERALPSTSLLGFGVRVATVLFHAGALNNEEKSFLEHMDRLTPLFTELAAASTDALKRAVFTELQWSEPFLDKHVPAVGALLALCKAYGVNSSEFVTADIDETLVRLSVHIRNMARCREGLSGTITHVEYERLATEQLPFLETLYPELKEERLLEEMYLDDSNPCTQEFITQYETLPYVVCWHALFAVVQRVGYGEYLGTDEDLVNEGIHLASHPWVRTILFNLEDRPRAELELNDMGIEGTEGPLSSEQTDMLAINTGIGLATGLDEIGAVTNAILGSREYIQGPEYTVQELQSSTERAAVDFFEATRGVRDLANTISWGTWRARRWFRSKTYLSTIFAPMDALLNFLGTIIAAFGISCARGVGAILSLAAFTGAPGERWYHDVVATFIFYLQMLDPRHRANPKSVWALLFKRRRANITKTEEMFFSIKEAHYEPVGSYGEWVDQMAAFLQVPGIDTNILSRVPPSRILFRPNDPVGVKEYDDIDALADIHFTETPYARRFMDESLAAGNPLTVDAAYLATAETTNQSLARYTVARPIVSDESKTMLTLAADAIFDQYKPLYDRPLPMTPRAVAHLSKWKYSAGLPFLPAIKKRETLRHSPWFNGIITGAERMLKTGRIPAVGSHGFAKSFIADAQRVIDEPTKGRSVVAGDRPGATMFNSLLMERNKRVATVETGLLNMMRRSEGGILQLDEFLNQHEHKYSGDGRAFDSTVASEVATIGSVRLYERGINNLAMYNTKAAVSVVHAYYEALTAGLIVNLTDGSVIWKTGGGGTGSAATTADNRDWTTIVFVGSWIAATGRPAKEFFQHFAFTHASDDVFFSCDDFGETHLPDMLNEMHARWGVDFAVQQEDEMNNILHLTHVPVEELDARLYELIGVDLPKRGGLRHSRKRLLFTRSAFRSDRMRLNPIVASSHIAERSTGYQLLTAHSLDLYELVTRDLVDALLSVATPLWPDAEALLTMNENGAVIDGTIRLPRNDDGPPTRELRQAAIKALRRGYQGTANDYYRERRRQGRSWINQRKGKSYKEVFHAWVKPPPAPEESKAGRRWLRYYRATVTLGPLSDMLRLGVLKMYSLQERIPRALTGIAPEKAAIPMGGTFNTWDFTVEHYLWRREYLRTNNVPTPQRMNALALESPFKAATDISAFQFMLSVPGVLEALMLSARGEPHRSNEFIPSNDAVMGRLIALLVWYTSIDYIIRAAEKKLVFGVFVIAVFGLYRWLEAFYSLQSLAYWVCTGMASLAISNSMPKDRYILQKMLAAMLASATPRFLTDWLFGSFVAIGWLAPIIELQALVPFIMLSVNNEVSMTSQKAPDSTWDIVLKTHKWDIPTLIHGATGSGKSTALVAGMLRERICMRVIILVATSRMVTGYVNDFIDPLRIQRVMRGDPPLAGNVTASVLVMTYGQFIVRARTINPEGLFVLFDEGHQFDTTMARAMTVVFELRLRWSTATATPEGALCDRFSRQGRLIEIPPNPRAVRLPPLVVADYSEAYLACRSMGCPYDETMTYHPSVTHLNKLANGLSSLGVRIGYATRLLQPDGRKAALFVTGVVLTGANIRPAPRLLIAERVKYVTKFRPLEPDVPFQHVDGLNFIYSVGLELDALTETEAHQLASRVGREREGRVLWVGEWTPSKPVSSGVFADLHYTYGDAYTLICQALEATFLPTDRMSIWSDIWVRATEPPGGLDPQIVYNAYAFVSLLATTNSPLLVQEALLTPSAPPDSDIGEARTNAALLLPEGMMLPASPIYLGQAMRDANQVFTMGSTFPRINPLFPLIAEGKLVWFSINF